MKYKIGTFLDDFFFIVLHSGDDSFDRFFAHLLGDLGGALLHAFGDIGFIRVALAALLDNII